MKVLIIDDTRLARNELKHLLSLVDGIELVGEARDADEAEQLIQDLEPDLLFLDIQMPGRNGFELLESLDHAPEVIFTTAYNEYALKAFDYNALDYLQKPIQQDRLERAVEKCRTKLEQLKTPKTPVTQHLKPTDRVFVKDGENCWFVSLEQIRLLEVDGSYTRVYFEENQPLISKSLNQLEARLDPAMFFRANRQQIVNLSAIDEVTPWFSGGLKLTLKGGDEVEVSRRQTAVFKELMSL